MVKKICCVSDKKSSLSLPKFRDGEELGMRWGCEIYNFIQLHSGLSITNPAQDHIHKTFAGFFITIPQPLSFSNSVKQPKLKLLESLKLSRS
jgi:hypothetical protein